jgi:hypothetical protein
MNIFAARRFVKPHIHELIHSSASLVTFFPVLACVLSCTCRDEPSWWGQLMCARVDNQRSRGVVIARLWSSVRSLLPQSRDLHQLTYLYLVEYREPTSHLKDDESCLKSVAKWCHVHDFSVVVTPQNLEFWNVTKIH